MNSMDYWRLADELSVIDAAILITGNDPSDKIEVADDTGRFQFDNYGQVVTIQKRDHPGFDAAFRALRNAVISNRIPANIILRARVPRVFYEEYQGEFHRSSETDPLHGESRMSYEDMIRIEGCHFLQKKSVSFNGSQRIVFFEEPDWENTTIDVEEIKKWLDSKGVRPAFFFPKGHIEAFRDQSHPRYSAKLACAVAAWEAVTRQKPNKSPKATLEEWIRANAVRFGMVKDDGIPSTKAVEETAAVANWATSGGAVPTAVGVYEEADPDEPRTVENFEPVQGVADDADQLPF